MINDKYDTKLLIPQNIRSFVALINEEGKLLIFDSIQKQKDIFNLKFDLIMYFKKFRVEESNKKMIRIVMKSKVGIS